ncbi:hypothetical protein [Halorubrum sp. CBA1229]|nr:hypothetical protein [Halorubrum sp. CBA1229]
MHASDGAHGKKPPVGGDREGEGPPVARRRRPAGRGSTVPAGRHD